MQPVTLAPDRRAREHVAKTGDRFEMLDGSVYAVTAAAADSGGEFVGMEFTLPTGSVPPPPHVHHGLTEEYEVIEGAFDVMSAGAWTTLGPGESASIPPDTLHTFQNRSGALVRVRNIHRPAVRFEDYIEHIFRRRGRGRLRAKGTRASRSTYRC